MLSVSAKEDGMNANTARYVYGLLDEIRGERRFIKSVDGRFCSGYLRMCESLPQLIPAFLGLETEGAD